MFSCFSCTAASHEDGASGLGKGGEYNPGTDTLGSSLHPAEGQSTCKGAAPAATCIAAAVPASDAVMPVAKSDSCLQEVAGAPVADNGSGLQETGKDMLTIGVGGGGDIAVAAAVTKFSADATRACLTFRDGWIRTALGHC